jgi:hypothetical protein
LELNGAMPVVVADLPVAAELVRENDFEDAVRSVFSSAGVQQENASR